MGERAGRRQCLIAFCLLAAPCLGQQKPPAGPAAPSPPSAADRRTELNLLARTDTAAGENRRNENVQFNLIDNNALKELNLRLGTTATLFDEFLPDRGYFGSEFGNRPPSPVHLSPSRAAAWHGNLFAAHSNSVFNARSFFTAGRLKPAHENQYGMVGSLPLWRGAVLTADLSRQHVRGFVNGNVLVPLAAERTPLATDPARRAIIQRFLDAFPRELPNRTDINERALNTNSPQAIDDDNATLRLDQALGPSDTLALRYQYTAQYVDAFQLVAGQNPDTTTRAHTAQLTWIRSAGPNTQWQLTAAFDRVGSLLVPEPNAVGPQVNFSNVIATLGPSSTIPIDRAQNRFRYAASIRRTRGPHNFSAGAELGRRQTNGFEASSHRGNVYFRNDLGRDVIANFLLGIPSRFSGATGDVHRGYRWWDGSAYAGDVWRLSGRFTLSYGLRWEAVSRPSEVRDLDRIPYSADLNNFAPRAGLAWALPRSWGRLRLAYGLHYGEIFPITFQQVRYNPPLTSKFEIQVPDLAGILSHLNVPVEPGQRSTFIDISPRLVVPFSHQANLTWETDLGRSLRLQFGYVGSRSKKLFMMWYTNRARPVPGIPQTTATINDRRPDPRFYDYRRILNGSMGYFDAARLSLVLPRWRGFSVESAYWFSKAIDLGAAYTNTGAGDDGRQGLAQWEYDVWRDMRGPSNFDQKHAFLTRGSWRTPRLAPARGRWARWLGVWNLSAVLLLKTGTPFTVFTGSDAPGYGNVDGDQGDRPHLLDPAVLGRTIGHPDTSQALLPRAAFAYPAPTDGRGNLGSNTFRRAGIANVNASLSRSFSAGADRKIEFRAESVNLSNTPQFAEPWKELSSPSFGAITNTLNDGRAFRFLLRLSF